MPIFPIFVMYVYLARLFTLYVNSTAGGQIYSSHNTPADNIGSLSAAT